MVDHIFNNVYLTNNTFQPDNIKVIHRKWMEEFMINTHEHDLFLLFIGATISSVNPISIIDTRKSMRKSLRDRIITICNKKIEQKGDVVGVSFYAFFANKNDDPELLMEAATWWIKTHKLNHFEKANKIIAMVESGQ